MPRPDPNNLREKIEALRQYRLRHDKWSREYAKIYSAKPESIHLGWGLGGAVLIFFAASYMIVRNGNRAYRQIEVDQSQDNIDLELITDPKETWISSNSEQSSEKNSTKSF